MQENQEAASDEELMLMYQNGDESAFRILFQRHAGKVYGFMMNRTKNRALADDLFQTSFLKLHRARHHYKKDFPFEAWLFTLCKNTLIDHQRKEQRNRQGLESSTFEVPSALEDESSNHERVLNLMELLPAAQRSAVKLRYQQELDFEEIARHLKTSPSNVRQLVSRGIRQLRALLNPEKKK